MALPGRVDHEHRENSSKANTAMYEVVALLTTRARQRASRPPSWGGLAASVLLVAAIPAGLWLLAHPVVGVALVGLIGSVVVAVCSGHPTRRLRRDGSGEAGPLVPVRTGALRSRR